ncbi:MAG: RNA-binding S4 domain-containing protein [Lachnospiraceae bacterium]|nr:RNA-binding S4 domain-containing protein [Lachnospiraceae bacterium]
MNFTIKPTEDHIKLGQLLKAVNLVFSGSEGKAVILNGEVEVNGEVCLMRGKKIVSGDKVSFNGEIIEVS